MNNRLNHLNFINKKTVASYDSRLFRNSVKKTDQKNIISVGHTNFLNKLHQRMDHYIKDCRLDTVFVSNRWSMISIHRDLKTSHFRVRLHHIFVSADDVMIDALAHYIVNHHKKSSKIINEFINTHKDDISHRMVRPRKLVSDGDCYDLQEIYHSLNKTYFNDSIQASITWSRRSSQRKRNSIKMGSYSMEDKLIRIHRSLDREFVPRFFIEWIIYHEMLHQVHGSKIVNGRRLFHTPEFLEDEKKFKKYNESRRWQDKNIEKLLSD